jgi:hypothetical protein
MKYIAKPYRVNAWQWNGEPLEKWPAWLRGPIEENCFDVEITKSRGRPAKPKSVTVYGEGGNVEHAWPGDWFIGIYAWWFVVLSDKAFCERYELATGGDE